MGKKRRIIVNIKWKHTAKSFPRRGLLKKPKPCHCEECWVPMWGGEHDEAISIYTLPDAGAQIASSSLPPYTSTHHDSSK